MLTRNNNTPELLIMNSMSILKESFFLKHTHTHTNQMRHDEIYKKKKNEKLLEIYNAMIDSNNNKPIIKCMELCQ